jgi:hypothetical protein
VEKENKLKENILTLMEQGNKYFEEKKYKEAIEEYSKLLELMPDNAEALMRRGLAKYKNAPSFGTASDLIDKSGALNDFYEALSIDSSVKELLSTITISKESISTLLNNKAWRNIGNKEFELTIKQLSQALLLTPNYSMAMLTMAEAYTAMGKDEEALTWLEKAVELYPQLSKDIDGYDCYKSLHSYERYHKIIGKKPHISENNALVEKSFYYLEMIAEPGGMREYFQMVSGSAESISQMIIARIKTDFGFYALLSYGQTIQIKRYLDGKYENMVDIHPFLQVTVPEKLTAYFTEEGEPVIRDMEGKEISEGEVSDMLFDYNAYEEASETVILGDWEVKLGELTGDILKSHEEVKLDGNLFSANIVYELESGEEYSLEEFLEITKQG